MGITALWAFPRPLSSSVSLPLPLSPSGPVQNKEKHTQKEHTQKKTGIRWIFTTGNSAYENTRCFMWKAIPPNHLNLSLPLCSLARSTSQSDDSRCCLASLSKGCLNGLPQGRKRSLHLCAPLLSPAWTALLTFPPSPSLKIFRRRLCFSTDPPSVGKYRCGVSVPC